MADNNINTFIITGFTDPDLDNNNGQEKSPVRTGIGDCSPVLTIENLPRILVTSVSDEMKEAWAPEIPFQSLASNSTRKSDNQPGRKLFYHSEIINNFRSLSQVWTYFRS